MITPKHLQRNPSHPDPIVKATPGPILKAELVKPVCYGVICRPVSLSII